MVAAADRLLAVASVLALAGCTVEPERRAEPLPAAGDQCELSVTSSPSSVSLAENQRLTAEPGQGAGVLVSSQGGGKWTIDAVCDTAKSGLSCTWDLRLRAVGGSISTPLPEPPTSNFGDLGVASGEAFARFVTTTEWDSFTVTVSPADAALELETSLDGCAEPRVVYWMGPDAVHYGAPTDPVIFVSTPSSK